MVLDVTIVTISLLLTLFVGIYKSRGITSMYDYALASKNYPTPLLIATLSATMIGSEYTIGIVERVYQEGLMFIVCCLGDLISISICGFVLGPRVVRMVGVISAGDAMEKFYGKYAKVITGICGALFSIGFMAAQISGIGFLFNYFFGYDHAIGTIIGCSIVILYSSYGGIRAVSTTDVIQFIIMSTAIPLILNVGLNRIGGYHSLIKAIPESHIFSVKKIDASTVSLFLLFAIPFLDPSKMQRLLMAKNVKQLQKYLAVSLVYTALFIVAVGTVGMISYILYPQVKADLALLHMVKELVPFGVRGIVVAGLLAVIMSTADSFLNTASISIVHDIAMPLSDPEVYKKNELKLVKFVTLAVGAASLVFAITMKTVFDIIFEFINCWAAIVVVPLFAGLFDYKASARTFYVSAIGGGGVLLLSYIINFEKLFGVDLYFIPSMLASAICFFGHSIFERSRFPKVA